MKASELYEKLKGEIGKELFGKEESIRYVVTALLAGGHVLLEDVPGTGKTSLVRALAAALGAASLGYYGYPFLQSAGGNFHPAARSCVHQPAAGRRG